MDAARNIPAQQFKNEEFSLRRALRAGARFRANADLRACFKD